MLLIQSSRRKTSKALQQSATVLLSRSISRLDGLTSEQAISVFPLQLCVHVLHCEHVDEGVHKETYEWEQS